MSAWDDGENSAILNRKDNRPRSSTKLFAARDLDSRITLSEVERLRLKRIAVSDARARGEGGGDRPGSAMLTEVSRRYLSALDCTIHADDDIGVFLTECATEKRPWTAQAKLRAKPPLPESTSLPEPSVNDPAAHDWIHKARIDAANPTLDMRSWRAFERRLKRMGEGTQAGHAEFLALIAHVQLPGSIVGRMSAAQLHQAGALRKAQALQLEAELRQDAVLISKQAARTLKAGRAPPINQPGAAKSALCAQLQVPSHVVRSKSELRLIRLQAARERKHKLEADGRAHKQLLAARHELRIQLREQAHPHAHAHTRARFLDS
jgi:hypothetical protein